MEQKVAAAQDLKIVGIINPPEGSNKALALTAGINYPYELAQKSIEIASESAIVKDQLSKPDVDVLTGKTFAEEKQNSGVDTSVFSGLIEINENAFYDAFSFDVNALNINPQIDISQEQLMEIITSTLTPELIKEIITDISSDESLTEAMQTVIVGAVEDYLAHGTSMTPTIYFAKGNPGYEFILAACASVGIETSDVIMLHLQNVATTVMTKTVEVFSTAILQAIDNISGNLANLGQAFKFNAGALQNLFHFNLTSEKLMQLSKLISNSGKRTYDSNLADFGYADLTYPLSITIYPNDFYAKERISDTIDEYNLEQEESGHEEEVISYTDYAKLLMSSITTMIDMITAVLVAFVAISLVVSSIMIGIITYISVLERRREIGILRAIGARKRDIFNVFNAETFIIGLIAGFIGISFTALGCIPANIIARAIFNVEYDIAILPF